MRLLLVSHEFEASTSPQAYRWQRLSELLADRGHAVTVVTGGAQGGSPGIRVVDTGQGLPHRLVGRLRRILGRPDTGEITLPVSTAGLNLRGRLAALLAHGFGFFSFPDLRGYWTPVAEQAVRRLVAEEAPDVVVASHEPASALEVGLLAGRLGVPWVADLGDPVCASYTPRRWRRRARRLERQVCKGASMVVVTNEAYGRHLQAEHGLPAARLLVLRQGFDPRPHEERGAGDHRLAGPLELLYTGQLYGFRRPEPLIDALDGIDGVRFTVISPTRDPALSQAARRLGAKLRIVGALPRHEVAAWQSRADILVNLGNRMPLQIPGKLFEYFGAGRGVLHVSACEPDEAAGLVRSLRRGWVVGEDSQAIGTLLVSLRDAWRAGRLERDLDLSERTVARFAWPALATQLETALVAAAQP